MEILFLDTGKLLLVVNEYPDPEKAANPSRVSTDCLQIDNISFMGTTVYTYTVKIFAMIVLAFHLMLQ